MASYKHKRSSTAGKIPAPQSLLVGEIAINLTDRKLYSKDELGTVFSIVGGGDGGGDGGGGNELTPFIGLKDTPPTYVGQGGLFLQVKQDETGIEFVNKPSGGGLGGGFDPSLYLGYGYPTVPVPDPKKPSETGNVRDLQEVVNHLFTYAASGKDALIAAFKTVGLPAGKESTFHDLAQVILGLKGYTYTVHAGTIGAPTRLKFEEGFTKPIGFGSGARSHIIPVVKEALADTVDPSWDTTKKAGSTTKVTLTTIEN